jgi:hypothetical protein
VTEEQVDAIRTAVDIIRKGGAIKRVDGDTFTAYKVGQLVRVDIKQDVQLDGKVAR